MAEFNEVFEVSILFRLCSDWALYDGLGSISRLTLDKGETHDGGGVIVISGPPSDVGGYQRGSVGFILRKYPIYELRVITATGYMFSGLRQMYMYLLIIFIL